MKNKLILFVYFLGSLISSTGHIQAQCSTCDVKITTGSGTLELSPDAVTCITEDLTFSDIKLAKNATLCIASGKTLTIVNSMLDNKAEYNLTLELYGKLAMKNPAEFNSDILIMNIHSGGSFEAGNTAFKGNNVIINNQGIFHVEGLNLNGNNSGTINIFNSESAIFETKGNLNVGNNIELIYNNEGRLVIGSQFGLSAISKFSNCGVIETAGFNLESGTIYNTGKIFISGGIDGKGEIHNYGTIELKGISGSGKKIYNYGTIHVLTSPNADMEIHGPTERPYYGEFRWKGQAGGVNNILVFGNQLFKNTDTNGSSSSSGMLQNTSALKPQSDSDIKWGDCPECIVVNEGVECIDSETGEAQKKNYWLGGKVGAPNKWDDKENWTANRVPGEGEDIEFATEENNPTKEGDPMSGPAKDDLYVPTDDAKVVKDLINESDKALVVLPTASITVTGEVVGSDTLAKANKIQIKANSTEPNGTFIVQDGCSKAPIFATVEMYSKASEINPHIVWQDTNKYSPDWNQTDTLTHTWQYFGIPVQQVDLSTLGTANAGITKSTGTPTFWLRERKEERNDPNHFYRKWKYMTTDDKMDAFWGYEVTQNAPATYTFRGELNLCEKSLTLTRQASEVAGVKNTTDEKIIRHELGQHVVANSYTAAMTAESLEFDPALDKVVYLYNTGSIADWQTNKANGALAGGYLSIPANAQTTIWDRSIPSMQGFMVKYTTAETKYSPDNSRTLKFKYTGLVKNSEAQRAPEQNSDRGGYLRVVVSGENSADAVLLIEKSGTTSGFDNGWDGEKIDMPNTALYLPTEAGDMQVSADATIIGKYIAFKAGADEEYTLTLTKDNLGGYSDLKLVDLATKTVVDLSKDETTYKFRPTIEGKHEKRFLITRGSVDEGSVAEQGYTMLSAYMANGTLVVSNLTGKAGSLTLHDLAGRTLQASEMKADFSEFDMSGFPSGVYMVTLRAGNAVETVKVVVR